MSLSERQREANLREHADACSVGDHIREIWEKSEELDIDLREYIAQLTTTDPTVLVGVNPRVYLGDDDSVELYREWMAYLLQPEIQSLLSHKAALITLDVSDPDFTDPVLRKNLPSNLVTRFCASRTSIPPEATRSWLIVFPHHGNNQINKYTGMPFGYGYTIERGIDPCIWVRNIETDVLLSRTNNTENSHLLFIVPYLDRYSDEEFDIDEIPKEHWRRVFGEEIEFSGESDVRGIPVDRLVEEEIKAAVDDMLFWELVDQGRISLQTDEELVDDWIIANGTTEDIDARIKQIEDEYIKTYGESIEVTTKREEKKPVKDGEWTTA